MRWIEIKKSSPLIGDVKIPGSKNSSLGILVACCLCDEPIVLENVPDILDVKVVYEIARDIGMEINEEDNHIKVNPKGIVTAQIDPQKASAFRASYYFIGALLSKFKKVSIGYPGGDNFGSRPIDQHIKGFEALGACVKLYKDYYTVEANNLIGTEITFDLITSGATINLLLAAAKAKGKTTLRNAARDPEVVDVAIFLNKMGAKIKGAGTDIITIEGVEHLTGCQHAIIPDRLIAGTFLMCAGITEGRITVRDVIPEHILSCTSKLIETGLGIEMGEDYVTAFYQGPLKSVQVMTGMYPEFGTDFQQPLTTMLTKADSMSIIKERIFPNRFKHCTQLNKMGANITINRDRAIIPGGYPLKGTWVEASDIRAGISLILAGLAAQETTYITGVEHIERGYPDFISVFRQLGANIKISEKDQMSRKEEVDVC